MAISLLDNLNIRKKRPNVERDLFDTISDMVAYSENYLPEVFECNVKSTGERYRYNVNNEVLEGLGKWRLVLGGESSNIGEAGFSPTIVENSENTDEIYKLDITDKNGTFTTPNLKGEQGIQGSQGERGEQGIQGEQGEKGFSPTITENEDNTEDVYKLDIINEEGTFTTPNLKAQGTSGTSDHNVLENRNIPNQHPIEAITGLKEALQSSIQDVKVNGESVVIEKVAEIEIPETISITKSEYDQMIIDGTLDKTKRYIVSTEDSEYLLSAGEVSYNNSDSGLLASSMQSAIDEVNSSLQHNWLKGKTINFLGDSITKGHISNSEVMERPYPSNVATILNCICNNYGVSGSTLVDNTAPYSYLSFIDRMVDMDKTANVNVVMGGTNDYAHSDVLLGNFSDTGSSTIYGALKTIAEYLIAEFPNAINIFCAPLRFGSSTNNGRYSMEELVYAIKSVAKHYGFIFIDTYHNLPGWIPSNATLLARYGVNGTDTVHPNQLFSDTIFGPYMASSILRMDGGNALTPKDEIYVRDILDLTTYADSTWLTGKIKGWVEDGILHMYFYNATMLKSGGGARFNDDASWNNAEYKLNVPKTSVMGWQPLHIFNSNKIAGFIYAGNGTNAISWQYNSEYDGAFPTGVFFTSIEIPLDR